MIRQKSFAIIGGGIGGLTVAIALQQKGFHATVYENAPQLKPLGAGLGLAANAMKALAALGIDQDVLEAGKILKTLYIKDKRGRILTATDSIRLSARYGSVNNFTIHRADLHQVLISKLSPGTLLTGKGCTGFQQEDNQISIRFGDGTSVQADAVIACDGIHSIFRKKLVPASLPRYAGYTCWRAVVEVSPDAWDMDNTFETWSEEGRFGIVPLSKNRLYWFACVNTTANNARMQSWGVEDLRKHFGEFHAPIPQILMETRDEQLIWSDIVDIAPLDKFAYRNIVLLGDAAHATTPNMGQGACMAIEDSIVLANCLQQGTSIKESFLQFEQKRLARTAKIVESSRLIGRMAQLENPWLVRLRNAVLRLTPTAVSEKQLKFLYDVSF
jgi:2-polyprenyl-6-methoxyphenol hydroxylase-like FAD-dependent oxidoreductase